MLSYIVHAKDLKDCFDFLSERLLFIVLLDRSNKEISLVVKVGPENFFPRQIVQDPLANHYRLELSLTGFSSVEELVDFYHENYL